MKKDKLNRYLKELKHARKQAKKRGKYNGEVLAIYENAIKSTASRMKYL